MSYAGKVEKGVIVEAIVGAADWASANLGGEWVGSDEKIGVGWLWDEVNGFRPQQPFPSWVWVGDQWEAPTPAPDFDAFWDEDLQAWIPMPPKPDLELEPIP